MTAIPAAPLPDRQVRSRAGTPTPEQLATYAEPLLRPGDTLVVAGTDFAADIADRLTKTFRVIRSERRHPALDGIPPETPEYDRFSAAWGVIRSTRQFRQLVGRCTHNFVPAPDRWRQGDRIIDPFRPGLAYPALTDTEFDVLTERHLNAARSALRRADVLLLGLSHSEVCENIADGAVIPDPSGADPALYRMRTLDATDALDDLFGAIETLWLLNSSIRVILFVSPEPLDVTAASTHIALAESYGKAVLRVAMDMAARLPGISFLPVTEILAAAGLPALPDAAAVDLVARTLANVRVDPDAVTRGSGAVVVAGETQAGSRTRPEGGMTAVTEGDTTEAPAAPLDTPDDYAVPRRGPERRQLNSAFDIAMKSNQAEEEEVEAPPPAAVGIERPRPVLGARRPVKSREERRVERARRLLEAAKQAGALAGGTLEGLPAPVPVPAPNAPHGASDATGPQGTDESPPKE